MESVTDPLTSILVKSYCIRLLLRVAFRGDAVSFILDPIRIRQLDRGDMFI